MKRKDTAAAAPYHRVPPLMISMHRDAPPRAGSGIFLPEAQLAIRSSQAAVKNVHVDAAGLLAAGALLAVTVFN